MKKLGIFIAIGMISGIVLASFLKMIEIATGNNVYYLLFDTSYIPIIQNLQPTWLIETIFHFATCIISIYALYHILLSFHLEKSAIAYIVIFGLGSSLLYFLTMLSTKTPPITNIAALIYWTLGHILFSVTAVALIKSWVKN